MTTFFTKSDIGLTAEQSSGSLLDYGLDWSDWLSTLPGETIASSTWVSDGALTLTNQAVADAVTSVWVTGGTPGEWYTLENTIVTSGGRRDTRLCMLYVKQAATGGTPLFRSRAVALAKMRRDRLAMAAANALGDASQLSDDYLWSKLMSAQAEIANVLRVPLEPTHFFPKDPTPEQIASLAGKPWAVDSAYDYDPANYQGDRWGFTVLRKKPVQQVHKVLFVYPSPAHAILDVPLDWVKLDKRAGHMQFVPNASPFLSPIGGLVMTSMASGRMLPFAIEVEYTAGLVDVAANFPELVDACMKLAVAKMVEDSFLPQSGSISADGLSQSMSVDAGKYIEAVDRVLHGANGNGGVVARIHGIKTMVM
jgi:hypothetical protein